MARITVEDCLTKENNRFALVQLAAKRTKQLLSGGKALISDPRGNKAVVTALREIADGKVRFMTPEEALEAREQARKAEEEKRQMQQAQAAAQPSAASALENLFITPSQAAPAVSDGQPAPEGELEGSDAANPGAEAVDELIGSDDDDDDEEDEEAEGAGEESDAKDDDSKSKPS